jgi:hypothetical protein
MRVSAMHYDVGDGYLRAAECAGGLLATPAVADGWDQPSALRQWSVAGLAGHLARAVFTVQASLATPTGDARPGIDAVTYYAAAPEEDLNPESAIAGRIRDRGVEAAGAGAADLVARYSAALDVPTGDVVDARHAASLLIGGFPPAAVCPRRVL